MGTLGKIAESIKKEWRKQKVIGLLKNAQINTYTNMILISIPNNQSNSERLIELQKYLTKKGEKYYASYGESKNQILVSEKLKGDISRYLGGVVSFSKEKIGVITIRSPPEMQVMKGVGLFIYSIFSKHDVSVYSQISDLDEDVFVIEEKQIYKIANALSMEFGIK